MLSIIIAMNWQDIKREEFEFYSPTTIYFVVLLVFGACLFADIMALVKKYFKLVPYLSLVLCITTLLVGIEGTVFSRGYYTISNSRTVYKLYLNNSLVNTLNAVWIVCVCLIFVIAVITIVFSIKQIKNNRYNSFAYKEKCYKKVAVFHNYLEKGIISEEEYEKMKNDILKHIQ